MDKFNELRKKYPEFIYEGYQITDENDKIRITYCFNIPTLCEFHPEIIINKSIIKNKNVDQNLFRYIVFHLGLIESISYYKSTCSPKIIIKCGYLDNEQISWFKKILYNGLGELLYRNNINISKDDLTSIEVLETNKPIFNNIYKGIGNLIPVGGGKDSCVSLEILKKKIITHVIL